MVAKHSGVARIYFESHFEGFLFVNHLAGEVDPEKKEEVTLDHEASNASYMNIVNGTFSYHS